MLINKKLAMAIATGTIIINALAPAAFADTLVNGNGAESSNTVNQTHNNNTTNTQSNNATISNTVSTTSNTGDNTADFNTGGTVSVQTGGATNVTSISNAANMNQLQTGNPCGCNNPASVGVSQNGAFSDNTVNANNNNNSTNNQSNNALFTNAVDSSANTGGNSGDLNTGGGTSITTGLAANGVQVQNAANQNVMVGGNAGAGAGAGTGSFFGIGGNGALSNNTINATTNNTSSASQENSAYFDNAVSSTATTGDNSANFGTGGWNSIMTGGATNITQVSNAANRNILDTGSDCGCTTDGLTKIVGNGAFSTGTINATDNNNQTQAQANNAAFANAFDGSAASGDNSLSDSTAFFGVDPIVTTGSTLSKTTVSNEANDNQISNGGITLGGITFGWNPSSVMGGLLGF